MKWAIQKLRAVVNGHMHSAVLLTGDLKNAYPCKGYGQSRIYASFYYGDYDTLDLRRDATVTVSANSGACSESLISFAPGSRINGGLANNKWDESRMPDPNTANQRNSGINWVQMRMADVILLLAETYAELGDEDLAKAELTKSKSTCFQGCRPDVKSNKLYFTANRRCFERSYPTGKKA